MTNLKRNKWAPQKFFLLLILILHLPFFLKAQLKSFKPGAIWPDNKGMHINAHGGGILYHEGLYYWFGEHKIEGEAGNLAHVGVHCYSSRDLYNWKDYGIALKVSDDPNSDITKGCILERPKVIYNKQTKKFVMWFHLELAGKGYSAARTGVATADKANGPYTFIRSFRPNAGQLPYYSKETAATEKLNIEKPANKVDSIFLRDLKGGQMARDMTLYVDEDDKAYHIFSSEENKTLHIAELNDDYTSHTGKFSRVYPGFETEAPAIFKRNGKYYMIGSGCTGWAPNPARLFTSNSIYGPWKYEGNPCTGEGAQKTYGGQSTYILPVQNKKDAFIFMADKWDPKDAINGRYLWLPLVFNGEKVEINWLEEWNLGIFNRRL
ncbi:glycoside hydrolase family 43 protein [Desertivirga arenae]|uniref:glycoside hydrolase family 43 protein n=1 Tax=Desertivirga arenae TaxID=2810309 RepID=UPI001A974FF5|nr:glycoside hydrolase family 43 protein [Pedobacter sp. SYSU D00823]